MRLIEHRWEPFERAIDFARRKYEGTAGLIQTYELLVIDTTREHDTVGNTTLFGDCLDTSDKGREAVGATDNKIPERWETILKKGECLNRRVLALARFQGTDRKNEGFGWWRV